jgi:hypothetical protein
LGSAINHSRKWKLYTNNNKPNPRTDVEMCQAQKQQLNSKVPKPDKSKVKKVGK